MSDIPIAPTTKLEAVNILLGAIGMTPTTTLDADSVDVSQALDFLRDASRNTQAAGWNFNTEEEYPLAPGTDGTITVPGNVSSFTLNENVDQNWKYSIVVRGGKLYDRKTHSNQFTAAIKVTAVLLLEFEDLPQPAKTYITIRAARVFQDRVEGLAESHAFTERDEQTAWLLLQNYESDSGNYSLATSPDVAETINRNW